MSIESDTKTTWENLEEKSMSISRWLMRTYPFLSKYVTEKQLAYKIEELIKGYAETNGISISSLVNSNFLGVNNIGISLKLVAPSKRPTLWLDLLGPHMQTLYSVPLKGLGEEFLNNF